MRILLDSCIWPGARGQIEQAGHEVEWVGDWTADPGDEEILSHAVRNRQVIITLDTDFGEQVVAFRREYAGIMRLVDVSRLEQGILSAESFVSHEAELAAGTIVAWEPGRVRVRSGGAG